MHNLARIIGLISLVLVTSTTLGQGTLSIIEQSNIKCAGDCNGSFSIQITSSTGGPFSLSVDNCPTCPKSVIYTPTGAFKSFSGLCAGSYLVTALDSSTMQTETLTVVISQPDSLSFVLNVSPMYCLDEGNIYIHISGGVPPYSTYYETWIGNELDTSNFYLTPFYYSQGHGNLSAGEYNVVTQDANGCVLNETVNVPLSSSYYNTSCAGTIPLCGRVIDGNDISQCEPCDSTKIRDYWYRAYIPNAPYEIGIDKCGSGATINPIESLKIYGPFNQPQNDCQFLLSDKTPYFEGEDVASFLTSSDSNPFPPGIYYFNIQPMCDLNLCFTTNLPCEPPPCSDCLTSFRPEQGKKYIISAWVKEGAAPLNKASFTEPAINLKFTLDPSGVYTTVPFIAKGEIIDGWQKIEEEFTVPLSGTDISVELSCNSGDCFFDDIRIFPYDGSMKSYVYDPENMRFSAELDERNYATFYEYDEEGKLLRIKKETERGVMTIQETRNNSPK